MNSSRLLAALICLTSLCTSCTLSTLPEGAEGYHLAAHAVYPRVNATLEVGDLVFRRGHHPLFGGLADYSSMLAHWTDSDYSHVGLVYAAVDDTFVLVDAGPFGVQRVFLIDYLIEGPEDLLIMRLRDDQRHVLPAVLAKAQAVVAQDGLHDFPLEGADDRFYCAEIVDHVFREAGLPLADKIPISALPGIRGWWRSWFYRLTAWYVGADFDAAIAVVGNETIGFASSPFLEKVAHIREPVDWDSNPPRLLRPSASPPPSSARAEQQ